jgi:hypothetical protein
MTILLTWDFGGALGGTRTPNLLIRSQMLYPLSYERWTSGQFTATQESSRSSFAACAEAIELLIRSWQALSDPRRWCTPGAVASVGRQVLGTSGGRKEHQRAKSALAEHHDGPAVGLRASR